MNAAAGQAVRPVSGEFALPGGHAGSYELMAQTGAEDFTRLAPEWPEFIRRCEADHPFNTHEWLSVWWRKFGANRPLKLLTVRSEGLLVCCLPLMLTKSTFHALPIRQLTPWVNTHSFRSGVLCDPAHTTALVTVARYLAQWEQWDVLDMPYLPQAYRVHVALKEALCGVGLRYRSSSDMFSPYLSIDGSWDDYFGSLSSSRRQTLRRKLKKFEEFPGARVEIVAGRAADIRQRLEECWQISRRTWKHEGGSSIAADPVRMDFYSEIADRDWIVLGLAYLDRQPIAFEYDLRYRDTLYNLKLGYDVEFAKLSPGMVVRVAVLQWAHEHGVRIFDYMGHAADYKNEFGSGTTPHEDLRVYSRRLRGRLMGTYEIQIKPLLRRMKHRLMRLRAEASS